MPILRNKRQVSLEECRNLAVYMPYSDIVAFKKELKKRGYSMSEGARELILDWMNENKIGAQRGNKRRRTYNRRKLKK